MRGVWYVRVGAMATGRSDRTRTALDIERLCPRPVPEGDPTGFKRDSRACTHPVIQESPPRRGQGRVDSHLESAPIFLEQPLIHQAPAADHADTVVLLQFFRMTRCHGYDLVETCTIFNGSRTLRIDMLLNEECRETKKAR
jgi:hypothetical protein